MTHVPERLASDLSTETLLEMYRRMRLIRRYEEQAMEFYKNAEVGGTVHPAIGEEAISVGACFNLRPDDCITHTHRGHGDAIAKGMPLDRLMAELLGKVTGVCKGKGGEIHIADLSVGVVGSNGIIAGNLPTAVGLAFAFKLRGLDRVVLAFFGDGATNEGAFHESLNLASLWETPAVFVCHNNQYAACVPRHEHQRATQISDFAHGYGMPGVTVDGNDVLAVYEAVGAAVTRARAGDGPTLIDCLTYRLLGHHSGENQFEYRTHEEVDVWRARDPLRAHRNRLLALDPALAVPLDRIDGEVEAALAAAVEFARQSPFPRPEDAVEDLYVGVEVARR